MSIDKKHKALGRGLSALLPPRPAAAAPVAPAASDAAETATTAAPVPAPAAAAVTHTQQYLPIEEIIPNPLQPRTVFRAEKLAELAASIRENGIIQPLIVRRQGQGYQIVAGERRWRGAKLAGLKEVPVLVQEIADPQMLQLALIENIQREDLNPIETAIAYDRLGRELGLSQEEIGQKTGMDRTSIANMIRLLRLPEQVQLLVAENRLSPGHARALLRMNKTEELIKLAERAAEQQLSVRQIEAVVQSQDTELGAPAKKAGPQRDDSQDPNVRAAVEILERTLGTRVKIVELSAKRGRIEIEYYSPEDLDRLFQQIVGEKK
ncbi:MAG TPA: ParB/RepB/Spo0J family partition protein [Bryobacteraceae bacterium]|jgi:ParB family chromosome partitioning protein